MGGYGKGWSGVVEHGMSGPPVQKRRQKGGPSKKRKNKPRKTHPVGSDAAWNAFVKKNKAKRAALERQERLANGLPPLETPVKKQPERTIGEAKLPVTRVHTSRRDRAVHKKDLYVKGDWGPRKIFRDGEAWQRKLWGVWYLGGECVHCGEKDPHNLQFDHYDPLIKRTSKFLHWAQAAAKTELRRCQLLCKVCHKAKTDKNNDRAFRVVHGTLRYYLKYNCRCLECCQAKKDSRMAVRALSARFSPPSETWSGTKEYLDRFGY